MSAIACSQQLANPIQFTCLSHPPGARQSRFCRSLGIPVKVNTVPEGRRTVFRSEGEQQSERSDAGVMIVPEVFGFVNRKRPERSGGAVVRGFGVQGKGAAWSEPLG